MSLESEKVDYIFGNVSKGWLTNSSSLVINLSLSDESVFEYDNRQSLEILIPITIVYILIFLTGIIGNVSTCIVISQNKSMHTATNYYLFSLAISDLLLLCSGLPPEMYRMWSPWIYLFGEKFCFIQGLAAETSATASVLTITAFTVERYVAICHPFLSYTMSKLSRAIKFVLTIWAVSSLLALPQAIQFGIHYDLLPNGDIAQSKCTITWMLMPYIFEMSTIVIFIGPITIITILYILIGFKLRRSQVLSAKNNLNTLANNRNRQHPAALNGRSSRNIAAQKHVIKMLVAVVVAFFVCWAPFHAQRLLSVYILNSIANKNRPGQAVVNLYITLNYISGILYFLSTTINPVLYNIMSNKFREAFKSTFSNLICKRYRSRKNQSFNSLKLQQLSFKRQQQNETNRSPYQSPVLNDSEPLNSSFKAEIIPLQMVSVPVAIHNNKTVEKKKHYFGNSRGFRSRNSSESSSQTTVTTTLSKNLALESIDRHDIDYRGFKASLHCQPKNYKNELNRRHLSSVNFTTFAQKLGLMFRSTIQEQDSPDVNMQIAIGRHQSLDSGNSISNSSLHDVDDTEHSSSDLVKYMEELNQTIF